MSRTGPLPLWARGTRQGRGMRPVSRRGCPLSPGGETIIVIDCCAGTQVAIDTPKTTESKMKKDNELAKYQPSISTAPKSSESASDCLGQPAAPGRRILCQDCRQGDHPNYQANLGVGVPKPVKYHPIDYRCRDTEGEGVHRESSEETHTKIR